MYALADLVLILALLFMVRSCGGVIISFSALLPTLTTGFSQLTFLLPNLNRISSCFLRMFPVHVFLCIGGAIITFVMQ
jgi:hypothetical protein